MAKTKYIEKPEQLWKLFEDYKAEVKNNPLTIVEQKKGGLVIGRGVDISKVDLSPLVELPLMRPLTFEGFENFVARKGIIEDLGDYAKNKDERYSEYAPIITHIKREIREDLLTGGLCNVYNSNLTARVTGLTDKTDVTTDGKPLEGYKVTLNLNT